MSDALPDEAVGALTIGPTVLPIPRDARMQAISFNAAGTPVWELDGSAVDAARMVACDRGFAIGTGKAVVAVSPSTKVDFPVDENMVGGATTNKQSGSFIFWYNSGTPPGTSAEYRNNYILSDRALHSHKNFVPGYMFTAAICKESTYGAVSPLNEFNDNADRLNQIFEVPNDGGTRLPYPAAEMPSGGALSPWPTIG